MIAVFTHNFFSGKRIWSFVDNDWIKTNGRDELNIWYSGFFGMLCGGITNFIGTLLFTMSLEYSINAGINQGVIAALVAFIPIFCALLSYIFMKETMHAWEFVGMVIAIISCVIIAFTNTPTESSILASEGSVSPLVPIFVIIASTIFIAARSIIMKYYVSKGYNVMNIAFQSLFVDGLIGTIYLVYLSYILTENISESIIILCIAAGMISGIGISLVNYAISVGIAGPACALADLNPVIQTVLDYLFLNQQLDLFQIFGLLLGLIGCVIIGIGSSMTHLFTKLLKRTKQD